MMCYRDCYFLPVRYEWILIIIIALILIFGVKKIPELARSFDKTSREYVKARSETKRVSTT